MATETIIREHPSANEGLMIIQKYESFMAYMYPILLNADRQHHVFRDAVLAALVEPIGAIYSAAKSKQVSRLFAIDAQFATLRSHLRFMVRDKVRMISPKRHRVALMLLAEAGSILGAWIKKLGGQSGK